MKYTGAAGFCVTWPSRKRQTNGTGPKTPRAKWKKCPGSFVVLSRFHSLQRVRSDDLRSRPGKRLQPAISDRRLSEAHARSASCERQLLRGALLLSSGGSSSLRCTLRVFSFVREAAASPAARRFLHVRPEVRMCVTTLEVQLTVRL